MCQRRLAPLSTIVTFPSRSIEGVHPHYRPTSNLICHSPSSRSPHHHNHHPSTHKHTHTHTHTHTNNVPFTRYFKTLLLYERATRDGEGSGHSYHDDGTLTLSLPSPKPNPNQSIYIYIYMCTSPSHTPLDSMPRGWRHTCIYYIYVDGGYNREVVESASYN